MGQRKVRISRMLFNQHIVSNIFEASVTFEVDEMLLINLLPSAWPWPACHTPG